MSSFYNYNINTTFTVKLTSNFCGENPYRTLLNMNGRMYDPVIGRVLSPDNFVQDPNNAQNYNRYSYCLNNPLRYTDPSGMLIDKYFDENGNYLYDDGIGDNIRILNSSTYNIFTNFGEESLSETPIDILKNSAVLFSQSNINEDTQLKIYDYFNPTDLPLLKAPKSPNGGMIFHADKKGNIETINIQIRLENNKLQGISDNYYEIINLFSHEEQHYKDYKFLGISNYINTDIYVREFRAINAQIRHESFSKTRPEFQNSIKMYGTQFGYPFRMQRLAIPGIKF